MSSDICPTTTMEARIKALSLNNLAPSDEVEQELRELLRKDLQDLDKLDSEISSLENRLNELKTKRDVKQRTITQYQSFLSPLRRMSPEILSEIFYRCLPTHRNPIIKTTECPLLLTRVCSFWRAAAISEPRLWAQIYITFEDTFLDPDWLPLRNQALNILGGRLSIIKGWLARSGARPLSISIYFKTKWPSRTFSHVRDKDHHPIVLEFFKTLAQYSPRFEDLELRAPLGVYRILESMIEAPAMTELSSFRADMPTADEENLNPILFLKAPNLKEISVAIRNSSLLGLSDPLYTSVWRGLRVISCHDGLTPSELIFLLQQAPNLVHFKATLHKADVDSHSVSPAPGHISLPFLRTFSIIDNAGPFLTRNLGLYSRIEAPGVTWVEYTGSLYLRDRNGPRNDASIVMLLERLPALKKLTINCDEATGTEQFSILFESVPSISHFFVGYEERSPAGSLVRNPPSDTSPSGRRDASCLLDFDELIVTPKGSDVDSDPDYNNDPPLLPNLVSLEISSRVSDMTDESLISIITSRMNPPLPSLDSTHPSGTNVARLKHVAVVFYREQRTDIAAKIREYADSVGVDMIDHLSLDYPEPRPSMTRSLEPDYMLRDLDGRSWNLKDAGEYLLS